MGTGGWQLGNDGPALGQWKGPPGLTAHGGRSRTQMWIGRGPSQTIIKVVCTLPWAMPHQLLFLVLFLAPPWWNKRHKEVTALSNGRARLYFIQATANFLLVAFLAPVRATVEAKP